MQIGGSTAMAFRIGQLRACELLRESGFLKMEISALRSIEISEALRALASYVESESMHLPDKGVTTLEDLVQIIAQAPENVDLVVHPHLLWALQEADERTLPLIRALGRRLLIENLDCRPLAHNFTHIGPRFNDLLAVLPEARVCLDIAHALSVEGCADTVIRSLSAYMSRIGEIHLSFFSETNKHSGLDSKHWMWKPAKEIIAEVFAISSPRIILETPVANTLQARVEYDLANELCT